MVVALLAWECGRGLGHAVPLIRLARALQGRGWRTVLAFRPDAQPISLDTLGLEVCASPVWGETLSEPFGVRTASGSMAEVLAGAGLKSQRAVTAQVQAWHRIFAEHRPDLVVTDYAPGAILAARGRIRTVATGNGYTVPPERLRRFPKFHELAPPEYDETETLSVVNEALGEAGIAPLKRLVSALTGDEQCVCTLPFLDPYAAEREGPLLGPLLHASVDRRDNHAEGIFCYLRNAPKLNRLEELIGAVAGLAAPVTAFLPDVSDVRKDDLRQRGVNVLEGMASLTVELKRAKLLVHSGGHGMASAAALAGVPQVVVRFHIESYLTARALVARGVAREFDYFTVEGEELRDAIRAAFDDRAMAAEALRVAEEHESYRVRNVASEIADLCEEPAPTRRAAGESERNVIVESESRQNTKREAALASSGNSNEGAPTVLEPASAGAAMTLVAFQIPGRDTEIRPAPVERAWMDATDQRFAYRCLPLAIANAYGWEILCPSTFKATWNGEMGVDAIKIEPEEGTKAPAISHFGSGIITFHLPFLFRTAPSVDLMVQGPVNRPKDAIAALQGIIETDWAPSTFTMNWIFTQPEIEVEFEKGEPICHFFPIRRGELERVRPEMRPLGSDPELETRYNAWSAGRRSFNKELKEPGSSAQNQKWQKEYFRGHGPAGSSLAPADHRTKVRLRAFRKPDA